VSVSLRAVYMIFSFVRDVNGPQMNTNEHEGGFWLLGVQGGCAVGAFATEAQRAQGTHRDDVGEFVVGMWELRVCMGCVSSYKRGSRRSCAHSCAGVGLLVVVLDGVSDLGEVGFC
jgi:hypothetical protein